MIEYAPKFVDFVFVFILINIAFISSYKNAFKDLSNLACWFWIVVFCLFSRWEEDYFAMQDYFYSPGYFETFRDFAYQYVQWISLDSYIIFRLIIWGGAIYFVKKTIDLYYLPQNISCFIFAVMYLQTFSYPRASMAMALFFYSFSILATAEEFKFSNLAKAAFFSALAYPFHRSILPLILTLPLALYRVNSKKLLYMIIILAPLAVTLVGNYMASFSGDGINGLESTGSFEGAASFYSNLGNSTEFNWKFRLIKLLRTSSFCVAYIFLFFKFYWNNERRYEITLEVQPLFLLVTGILLLSLSFLYLVDVGAAYLIGERYLNMVGIPIVILLSYAFQKGYCTWKELLYLLILPFLYTEGYLIGKLMSPNIN